LLVVSAEADSKQLKKRTQHADNCSAEERKKAIVELPHLDEFATREVVDEREIPA
jgi:hypothetical protein